MFAVSNTDLKRSEEDDVHAITLIPYIKKYITLNAKFFSGEIIHFLQSLITQFLEVGYSSEIIDYVVTIGVEWVFEHLFIEFGTELVVTIEY